MVLKCLLTSRTVKEKAGKQVERNFEDTKGTKKFLAKVANIGHRTISKYLYQIAFNTLFESRISDKV